MDPMMMKKKMMAMKSPEGGEADQGYDQKMKVLEMLSDMAGAQMSKGLQPKPDGMGVSVMAPDEEGLKAGLGEAEELVDDGMPAILKAAAEGGEDMSLEDIEAAIAELEAKKAALMGKEEVKSAL